MPNSLDSLNSEKAAVLVSQNRRFFQENSQIARGGTAYDKKGKRFAAYWQRVGRRSIVRLVFNRVYSAPRAAGLKQQRDNARQSFIKWTCEKEVQKILRNRDLFSRRIAGEKRFLSCDREADAEPNEKTTASLPENHPLPEISERKYKKRFPW